jgi:hypothetical protein
MPDITPAQIVALVQQVLALLAAFSILTLTDAQTAAILAIATSVATTVSLIVGDAVIRNGRSRALGNADAVWELTPPAAPYIND